MLKSHLLFYLLLISFLFPLRSYCASLDFQKAREILYERSDALKAAQANVESKQEEEKSLKWLHGPTISAQGVQLWGKTRIDVERDIKTPLGPMKIDIKENYDFSGPRAAISGTIPIFTGGKIMAVQEAGKYATDEAAAKHRNKSVDLDAELIAKYFGMQLALSIERMRKDLLVQEDRELERAIKFEKEGMLSTVERMSVKVSRDKAAREHLKAVNDVRTARLQLSRLLNHDALETLGTPLFVLKHSPKPMDYWVNQALKNNPLIAIVEARMHQADMGAQIAQSSWFPQIFGFGQYFFVRHQKTSLEPEWLAGIGANLVLWDSKDRLASYKSARASLREAKAMHADARNQVRTDAETAWLNAQNAREQYTLTASTVDLARENLRLKSKGFGEGLYTALDVSQARDQLVEAELGRRVAAYQFVVNYAMLFAITGNMDEFMRAYQKKDVILEK